MTHDSFPPTLLCGSKLLLEALDAEEKGYLVQARDSFRLLFRTARKAEDRSMLGYLIARTSVTSGRGEIRIARRRLQQALSSLEQGTVAPFPLQGRWHRLSTHLVSSMDAFLLFQLRQEKEAFRTLQQLVRKLPDEPSKFEDRYAYAQIHHNWALACVKLLKYEEAHDYFRKALKGYVALGMEHPVSRVADGLGTLLGMIGKFREARMYLNLSLAIKQKFRDVRGQSISLGNLSRVALRSGDALSARRDAAKVLSISRKAQDARGTSVGLIYLGDVERFQGQELMEISALLPRPSKRKTQAALRHFIRAREYYLEACARGLDPVYKLNAEIGLAFVHHFLGSKEASARSLKEARRLYAGQQGKYPEIEEWIGECALLHRSGSFTASSPAKVSESVAAVVHQQRQVLELERAKKVQDSLLPGAGREIAGVKAEYLFVPASETSGDFYDFGEIAGAGGYALVGDVAGHGAEAAMLMVPVVVGFREKHDLGLKERLAHLNHLLTHHLSARHFVTLCAVKWQSGLRMAGIANAGHPSPIAIAPQATAAYVFTTDQPALGVVEDHEYKVDLLPIAPGLRLLLYSDGLSEARNGQGEMFEKHLLAEVARCAKQKKKEFLPSLHTALKEFCRGQALDDDLTLLLLKF
jgi:tetratricopeptide (TPR) repeat protein